MQTSILWNNQGYWCHCYQILSILNRSIVKDSSAQHPFLLKNKTKKSLSQRIRLSKKQQVHLLLKTKVSFKISCTQAVQMNRSKHCTKSRKKSCYMSFQIYSQTNCTKQMLQLLINIQSLLMITKRIHNKKELKFNIFQSKIYLKMFYRKFKKAKSSIIQSFSLQ